MSDRLVGFLQTNEVVAGEMMLAVGVLLAWAALAPRAGLLRPALACSLLFAVPHFAYHVASADELGTADNIVNLAALGATVAFPVALLWASRPVGEGSPRGGVELDGTRVRPL